jgi:hypothetical protein
MWYAWERQEMHTKFIRKPEIMKPLRRPTHMWEDTGMDIREIEWEGTEWMHLAQDKDRWRALVNMVINLQVP